MVTEIGKHGQEAVPAAPSTGVNARTGDGPADVLEGATVVVDVSNSPSFADDPVLEFFRTSTANLLAYSAKAGVGHHVCRRVTQVAAADAATHRDQGVDVVHGDRQATSAP